MATPSHLGHMDRVAATMPSQAHAGAAQEAPDIGQWEGQDVPLVRPSSCVVKGGIPSSRIYLPTYLSTYGQGTQSESLWYLQAVPVLFLCRGGGVEIVCPLMGSWDSGQYSLRQWFGQNAAYVAVFSEGYLKSKDARDEGLMYSQRSTIHLNLSNDSLEFF